MPSSDEDDTPTKSKPATPRRSPAARRAPNATPVRKKTSPAPRTPNTAPARTKTGGKKAEPTLLGDFLLGRPSAARSGRGGANATGAGRGRRRRSFDAAAVKRELRLEEDAVGRIPQPGGVKDRVKQWQKGSAAAAAAVVEDANSEPGGVGDRVEDGSVGEVDRLQIKKRESKRPGRRKLNEEEDERGKDGEGSGSHERSKSAPRKRVVSDSHWMKQKNTPPRKTAPIPKDFLTLTSTNPPLESKMQDWVKRTESDEIVVEVEEEEKSRSRKVSRRDDKDGTPRSRKVSRQVDSEETPTKRKVSPRSRHVSKQGPFDDGIRVRPSRGNSPDDGIRIKRSPDPSFDDGIRVKPSRENSVLEDGIRIKPIRKESSKRKPAERDTKGAATPRKTSERHLRPPDTESRGDADDWGTNIDDDASSFVTPSRSQKSKRRERKSETPESLDEIPFGNSAFSVLDLPVGAEAGTMKRPAPKRNNSFAVPKVFKKIYNEGMNIARDTVDPPRVGQNQPPSIESWLNQTTDPFVDRPSAPSSTLEIPESSPRRESYNRDDQGERDLTSGVSESIRSRRLRKSQDTEDSQDVVPKETPPVEIKKARETLPSMESSPPLSPTELKRSPATRNTSSPKSGRKLPLKDAFLEAFRGESASVRPKSFSNPMPGIPSMRGNSNPSEFDRPEVIISDEPPAKQSPRAPEHSNLDDHRQQDKALPVYPRRPAPTTGEHRLSTIASVETFSTSSSATGTGSDLSQTTVTQATVLTAPTSSSLSRKSQGSGRGPGLKRRLTKHSDLVSMLSLPDTGAPGRAKSIRSARSVRTTRTQLESATIQDLMRELADDEAKYMRELKTLVDGVIPVLLTCVLSKSDSAIAAGLFNPSTGNASDSAFTKPIVDMGIALERLKSLHKRIPLQDPHSFIAWAQTAQKTYTDYLASWRMGFQDVVVNLAPASPQSSKEQNPTLDEMPRNADGDVLNANGERADVQYMLKRPLVRAKYLCKIVKGVDKLLHSELSGKMKIMYEDFEVQMRLRFKQEEARMVDRAANKTDASRARDMKTMALAENVKIDHTRQVYAKDFFSLELQHSSGQRLECRVELLLRDKPSDQNDSGDVLVCATDNNSRWLLFAPLALDLVSARRGDHPGQMVIMARGISGPQEWRESFLVETDDDETITEWIEMLGTISITPETGWKASSASLPLPPTSISKKNSSSPPTDLEIPIGEGRQKDAEDITSNRHHRRQTSAHMRIAATLPHSIKEESTVSGFDMKDLNEALDKAGQLKRARPARYHSRPQSQPSSPLSQSPLLSDDKQSAPERRNPEPSRGETTDVPFMPKVRNNSAPSTPKSSSPLRESMRPEPNVLKKQQASTSTSDSREGGAPPLPAHRASTTPTALKKTPILESPTPKAKNRRSSSPLKHEYQPSDASETSSSETSDSQDDASFSESSDEELDAPELPHIQPGVSIYGRKISPQGSLYSLPNSTLAPSQSASQAPYQDIQVKRSPGATKKMAAMISSWSNKKGRWEDLWAEPCSIIISPGRIEAFEMTAAHSSPITDAHLELSGGSDLSQGSDPTVERPLISLELTPIVSLRQSTALDIEIQSPPRPESRLQCSGTVRYRATNVIDCQELYLAIHRSRMDNPKYKKLEEERMLNSFGTHAYESAIKGNRRRSWLGRKKSYRASTRAPSTTGESEQSAGSNSSAFSALKRMSRGSFNIGKSSIENSQGKSGTVSGPQSMYSSASSGNTPPRTPTSPSLADTSMTNGHLTNLGSENLKIRLYVLATTTKWDDQGAARLTITAPPPGMRQASALYNGLEKRVLVTRKPLIPSSPSGSPNLDQISENGETKKERKENSKPNVVLLDVILGANCFSRIGNNGIACNIWEDVIGDNGQVGTVGAFGGVSGRTRKWLFDTGNKRDADWIFGLLAMGR
ncbi:hypothetical protein D0Z07_6296 [Hyphodiscus hymeniophilus]|uniref:Uncharacterized protein n=1 Tax=Hyphodiscus hymeniophilus TaxID=353542 RepID=A0A9P6VF80_9HELO|nr:hypothetical protein D0Z07_6296 [Hyphodiscus hymeniophilus]